MSTTDFYTTTVDFSGSVQTDGQITKEVSHTFPTQVLDGQAALQSWEVNFPNHDHEFYAAGAKVENFNISEDTVRCEVSLRLRSHDSDYIDSSTAYARVLFIVSRD